MVNIIGHRRIALIVSALIFIISVIAIIIYGLKAGIDFKGGSLLEVSFQGERPVPAEIRQLVEKANFGSAVAQPTGNEAMIIKTRFLNEDEHQALLAELRNKYENEKEKVLENRFETIGPAISSQLKKRSTGAAIAVLIGIIVYVAYAFRRVAKPVASWKYGIIAIVALVHDVFITMGIFAILGRYLGVEVGTPFVVALLTILGYSVNDTIVIFDRIRENLIKKGADDFAETVNVAVNQTFARSINTTLTTLLVLFALFFFGGETIKYFSLALLIGIFLGAYSSIFVASPLLVEWNNWSIRRRGN